MNTNHLVIQHIPTGAWRENCYIVNNAQNQALIIDPGADGDKIQSYISQNSLQVCAILNTHAHYDHIGAVQFLKERHSVDFYLHSHDLKLMKSANLYVSLFEGTRLIEIPTVEHFLDDLDAFFTIQNFSITTIPSPGHTQGSVCLLMQNCLFTGDTLLRGKIGRVDLPGANEDALKESLGVLADLPEDIGVYPGHGKPTTIKAERNNIKVYIDT